MAINKVFKGDPSPIGNRVFVTEMHFGEQKTKSGLIITDDNGTTRGIYPRWAKVYSKGPENNDPYNTGDWVLIEHGRWTRSFQVETSGEIVELRMAESESILGYSDTKPDIGYSLGSEYGDHIAPTTSRPEDFING